MRTFISLWGYLLRYAALVVEVFTQKVASKHLGTADQYCHPDVKGKTCILTGATSGIGLEAARLLAVSGAQMVLACRNTAAAERLLQKWKQEQPSIQAEVWELDLSTLKGVRRFAEKWEASRRPLHVLINNAGVMSFFVQKKLTADGIEEHLAVNCLSMALLTLLLLPSLKRAGGSRVINVCSKLHELGEVDIDDLNFDRRRRRYSVTAAYSQSKLAQAMFTNALQRRLSKAVGIDVIAVDPGLAITNVVRSLPSWLQSLYRALFSGLLFSPAEGARSTIYCATDPNVLGPAQAVRTEASLDGPYFDSLCRHTSVAKQAMNLRVSNALWLRTLQLTGVSSNFLESSLSFTPDEVPDLTRRSQQMT